MNKPTKEMYLFYYYFLHFIVKQQTYNRMVCGDKALPTTPTKTQQKINNNYVKKRNKKRKKYIFGSSVRVTIEL